VSISLTDSNELEQNSMSLDNRNEKLKANAEKIVNFTPHDIKSITPEEIQRLFYDLQVYQLELEMQNEELQKTQFELSQANNRLNFTYHSVPVGILTLDFQGFITQSNQTFAVMLDSSPNKLIKKHFSKLIAEEDKNIFIQRFEAFFKAPVNKNIQLRLQTEKNTIFHALLKGNADDGSDTMEGSIEMKQRKLVVAVTDISEVLRS
jgi:PAS domain-containing protein